MKLKYALTSRTVATGAPLSGISSRFLGESNIGNNAECPFPSHVSTFGTKIMPFASFVKQKGGHGTSAEPQSLTSVKSLTKVSDD
eukprot:2472453-Rhodomonas_salina.3